MHALIKIKRMCKQKTHIDTKKINYMQNQAELEMFTAFEITK